MTSPYYRFRLPGFPREMAPDEHDTHEYDGRLIDKEDTLALLGNMPKLTWSGPGLSHCIIFSIIIFPTKLTTNSNLQSTIKVTAFDSDQSSISRSHLCSAVTSAVKTFSNLLNS